MKKIFSAFLLMTMMVFSVGSFVSCSDIEKEIATLDTQATENAAAIADLNSKIAALQTALNAAQADADAAQKAADAAAAAAATAKADAIAAAKAEVEAAKAAIEAGVATDLAAVNAKVASVEAALALKADKATVDLLAATLENYMATLSAEDTELWTSVSELLEALTNLQGRLDAAEMSIEDLTVAVNEAVESVKAINTSLASVYDILGVLANQIQSVVFVPEFATDVVYAQRYTVGTAKTNFIAVATYEVRPAKLAATVTSENVSFSSVDTKAAAAPEYFAAEVISTDATTGRIVVAAVINEKDSKDKKDDYNVLAKDGGSLALSLNIASVDVTELLIADSQPVNVDMVSSAYVKVTAKEDAPLAVVFSNKTTQYSNAIEMPWNTEVANSVKTLFNTDVCVLVDGRNLSVAEANALLGTELALATSVTATYEGKEEKKVYPIAVNGKDINATATLVESPDYTTPASLVGKKATATLVATVTDKAKKEIAKLQGTATYEIVNKTADFTFTDVKEIPWTYVNHTTAPAVTSQELKVQGFENIKAEGVAVDSKFYVYDAKHEKTVAEATVKVTSSQTVEVTIPAGQLAYKQGEKATYTFEGEVEYNKTTYVVKFNVTLAAKPVDQVIDLGTFNIVANTTGSMTIKDINPALATRTAIAAVDPEFAKVESAALNNMFKTRATGDVAENDGVVLNGKELESAGTTWAPTRGWAKFNLTTTVKDKALVDASTITINKVADYVNTIDVVETYTVCGVNFTYKATIVTGKPDFTFTTNNVYVNNGVAPVEGTVTVDVVKGATVKSTDFELNTIDLRNLVHVVVPADYVNDYRIKYELDLTSLKNEKGEFIKVGDHQLAASDFEGRFNPYSSLDAPEVGEFVNKFNWAGLDLTELTFNISLVSKTKVTVKNEKDEDVQVDNVFETVTVKVQIPELVNFAADKVVTTKYVSGQAASANIVKALTITDYKNNVVYNKHARTLNELFMGYKENYDAKGALVDVDFDIANPDFFNVYEMSVVPAAKKDIKVYLNGTAIDQSQIAFTFENGTITLTKENINVTGDLKFEVPVTFTHVYDNYGANAHQATAVVVFSQNEGDNAGADVNFETPDGKQWFVEDGFHPWGLAPSAKMTFDFGTTPVNGYVAAPVENAFVWAYYNETSYPEVPTEDNPELLKAATWYAHEVMSYTVKPTDATSGVIEMYPMYPDATGALVPYTEDGATVVKYSNYTGTTISIHWLGDEELVNCTLSTTSVTPAYSYFNPAGTAMAK